MIDNGDFIRKPNRQNLRSFSTVNRNSSDKLQSPNIPNSDKICVENEKWPSGMPIQAENLVIRGKPRTHLSHSRRRSHRRFYEPSSERFPPERVIKSNFKTLQEMPFWRLDPNRFRRIMIASKKMRIIQTRLEYMNMLPFANIFDKNIDEIFPQPNAQKLMRDKFKHELKTKIIQKEWSRPKVDSGHRIVAKKSLEGAINDAQTILKNPTVMAQSVDENNAGEEKTLHSCLERNSDLVLTSGLTDSVPVIRTSVNAPITKLMTGRSISSCRSCKRSSYAVESVEALGQIFHNTCFKCSLCAALLHRGSWNHSGDRFFCNPCHRKLSLQTLRH